MTATSVPVIVTYKGWNPDARQAEAAGYAQTLVTEGATCTLTLTQGTASRSATHDATPSASTTQCGTLAIPASQLGAGTWTGIITFAGQGVAGQSSPFSIEVGA